MHLPFLHFFCFFVGPSWDLIIIFFSNFIFHYYFICFLLLLITMIIIIDVVINYCIFYSYNMQNYDTNNIVPHSYLQCHTSFTFIFVKHLLFQYFCTVLHILITSSEAFHIFTPFSDIHLCLTFVLIFISLKTCTFPLVHTCSV